MTTFASASTHRLLAALLLAAGALASQPSLAAPVELPPLGLYRIDTDGTMAFSGNPTQVRITTEGEHGDTSARWQAGANSATRDFKGSGPVTHCVKAVTGGTLPLPPQANACTVQSITRIKDGFTQTANCSFGRLDLTVHQLDKERWEYLTDMTMMTTGAAPDMSVLAPMLKQQAEHGETPEIRARAKQQLAGLPGMQKQGDATYAATIARMKAEMETSTDPEEKAGIRMALDRMQAGTPTMKTRSRTVWTRISNVCDSGK
ncbi:hypothetical protein [Pseudoduganella violaceinigra]|uniref:hypothetical protein n=1 Tax=Pseudoduganella violaceinigra TaxID=246602 RepID=UPI000420DA2D|nr:hypothetical protein [Pseudoduganella violaceinigra]